MGFWRNIAACILIVAALVGVLWFLYASPRQIERRLREYIGEDVCGDWRFRSLSQEGLEELRAAEIVIPADPVYEWRELAVLTGVAIRTDGPFVPALDRQQLRVSCAVGELSVERGAGGAWNCLKPGAKLLSLVRGQILGEFTCTEVLHIQIRQEENQKPWRFQLDEAHLRVSSPARVAFDARVGHESWAGGTLGVDLGLDPWSLSVTVEGTSFSGTSELLALVAGNLGDVAVEGTGDLTLTGETADAGMAWEGLIKGTDLRIAFPAAGLELRDLMGALRFQSGEVTWDALRGTVGGLEATSSGTLTAAPGEDTARIDFASVSLSVAWPRLGIAPPFREFWAKLRPSGVMRGSLQLSDPLTPSSQTIFGDFRGGEVTLGRALSLAQVQAQGRLAQGMVQRGEISWEGMTVSGVSTGPGKFFVTQGEKRWGVGAQLTLTGNGAATVSGDGEFTLGEEPALKLKLSLPPLPLADLCRIVGLKDAPQGTGQGDVDMLYTARGIVVTSNALSLRDVVLDPFLGKLLEVLPEGAELSYPRGHARFRVEADRLVLAPVVLLREGQVVVLDGEVTTEGQTTMKVLLMERGELAENTLFTDKPATWTLTPRQREQARCFELVGPVTGNNFVALTLDGFFGDR
jgi:hypothetical protein